MIIAYREQGLYLHNFLAVYYKMYWKALPFFYKWALFANWVSYEGQNGHKLFLSPCRSKQSSSWCLMWSEREVRGDLIKCLWITMSCPCCLLTKASKVTSLKWVRCAYYHLELRVASRLCLGVCALIKEISLSVITSLLLSLLRPVRQGQELCQRASGRSQRERERDRHRREA